jgi:hypothetical protein
MYVVKNTYGVSSVISPKVASVEKIGEFGGSSLNRKTYPKKVGRLVEELLKTPLYKGGEESEPKKEKHKTMSRRTKSKIRKKIMAFSFIDQQQSFLTLTFCNKVEDKKAVEVLASFLENANKRFQDFQYLWVAEKQENNKVFKDNIHFHIITNKFWNIKKWWPYWLELQKKHGIIPREESYKAASAFNVKKVQQGNIRGLVKYLTSYVVKNNSSFACQVWNCSKKISRLYTDFYTGMSIIREFERLEREGKLGGEIKRFNQEYCIHNHIPLNRVTLRFYERLNRKNIEEWHKVGKEVSND